MGNTTKSPKQHSEVTLADSTRKSNNHSEVGQVMPFSRDQVVNVLTQVKENDKLFVRRRRIHEILRISDFKCNELIRGCKSDEERLSKVVEFWVMWCPLASWRCLIWYMDLYEYHDVVDQICHYAEPLTVSSLTLENVLAIVRSSDITVYTLNDCLGVSDGTMPGVRKRISRLSHNDEQYKENLISWWLATSPYATWECLAESFAYWQSSNDITRSFLAQDSSRACKHAYAKAIKHIQHQKEGTFTPDNLRQALDRTPYQFYHQNERCYSTNLIKLVTSLNKEELVEYFLHRHPAPSWKLVAHFMYCTHEYEVLKYILGHFLNVNVSVDPEATSKEEEATLTSLLSVENVVKVLLQHVKVPLGQDTKVWSRPRYIGFNILFISSVTMDNILSSCTYNEMEQLEKLVAFWLKKCPVVSWRWLIYRLQDCHHIKAMKVIEPFAEPLTDSTLTVANLLAVFENVGMEVVGRFLAMPQDYVADKSQHQTEDELKQKMFNWWLTSSPFASWDMLHVTAEANSIEPTYDLIKSRLPDIRRPASLCLHNLEMVLKDISEVNCLQNMLSLFIDRPINIRVSQIEALYPHLSRKQAILQSYLATHPCGLSWRGIAYRVYKYAFRFADPDSKGNGEKLYQVISEIQKLSKGSSLQDLCLEVVTSYVLTLEDVEFLPLPNRIRNLIGLAMVS